MTEPASPRLAFLHEDPRQRGGGEAVLEHLARLAAARMPVDLALLFGPPAPLDPWLRSRFARVETFGFPRRVRPSKLVALARGRLALRRWLRRGGVQACVGMTFAAAFRGALATAGTGMPLAWMCNFSVRASGWPRTATRAMALRWLAASGAEAVCPSLAARDELAALGYPLARLRLIRNGVELARFADPLEGEQRRAFRRQHHIPEADLVVVHVARLDPVKNHEVVLRAVAAAASQGVRVCLVCLGDESPAHPGHAAWLRARASALGVADRVLFAGRRDDVPAWLGAADVAVLSSRTEVAALALIEAAAARLPLLASPVGSAPEIVVPGRSGYLFQPDDADACARHLLALGASPAHRRALGAEARRLAERSFDQRDMERRWQGLFDELMRRGAPGAVRFPAGEERVVSPRGAT